ncbi:4-hydroxyacetophenone monooxygenase [Methylobacterium sp. Leaf456]|uniref:flavin-containing monooxygenase n=1 Tax=Methylobacterium sp. Leaf456 TaxID=1736382 RepID=UPI0006FCC452|nr:NAD(P)/FAD-dependent oxidoreductase [Methylobacterium sp. Leaf456]KQT60850.1 4-hydroxyacetophenone monooxygenase [Methylobacterium sp. Leaf456]
MSGNPLDLVVVGAGFSGLAMAIRADRAGFSRLIILEKADRIGGTWRDNTYPGAASDVPAHLYSLSFAPRSDWSRLFPRQGEIQAYLQGLVAEHGLADRLSLGTTVRGATYDEASCLWRVETDRGVIVTRVLVGAVGALHAPARPALPGLDRFAGPCFHTAEWNHGCDLTGRRVGVVGTGASAVQIVPEIAGDAAHLTLFQRSPAWILPRHDRPYGAVAKTLLGLAPLRRLYRASLFWRRELTALFGFTRVSRLTAGAESLARAHLKRTIADPDLRRRLTPSYRLGCKRVLLSDDFYPTLARPDVSLVTEAIREVTPHGVVTADGAEHPLDVLILATGFAPSGSFDRLALTGRDGRTLAQAWRKGADAFHGIAMAGFPNLFLLLGPNTGLGHNSVLAMVEAQVAHVLGGLRWLKKNPGRAVEVRAQAQSAFRASVDARLADSIWARGGCGSWYLDEKGRNRTLWPGTATAYRRGAGRLRRRDYTLVGPLQRSEAAATGP